MRTAAALLLGLSQISAAPIPNNWPVYVNVLHRYRVCHPPSLVPQGETQNSAGQAFRSRDGAALNLYGYYADDGASLEKELAESAMSSAGPRAKISYRRERANWGVVSGSDGSGHKFYIKLLKRQDEIVKLDLRYPASLAKQYRPITGQVSQCFSLTR